MQPFRKRNGRSTASLSLVDHQEVSLLLFPVGPSQAIPLSTPSCLHASPLFLGGGGSCRSRRSRKLPGPQPAPERGRDCTCGSWEDHPDGPAPPAVWRRHPPRARPRLHQSRARARHHHCFQGYGHFVEGKRTKYG